MGMMLSKIQTTTIPSPMMVSAVAGTIQAITANTPPVITPHWALRRLTTCQARGFWKVRGVRIPIHEFVGTRASRGEHTTIRRPSKHAGTRVLTSEEFSELPATQRLVAERKPTRTPPIVRKIEAAFDVDTCQCHISSQTTISTKGEPILTIKKVGFVINPLGRPLREK